MIPADLASRLRMLSEASFFDSEPPVQGTARVREIQARLPQLLPGQQFTAHITRALPDNTFQAIVAGREYTLALSGSAKAGDTLELLVTKQTPNTVFARMVGEGAAAAANASRPGLSPTGRLISFLLTGQPAPQPASLAAGKPLLSAPPTNAGAALALAPALRQAMSQTGLFYEAHQARWLSGRLTTEALQREPQGQQPPAARGNLATLAETSAAPRVAANPMPAGGAATARGPDAGVERAADNALAASATRVQVVADRLMPIVHQQLDAMASQQYVLHGQAWPGQQFQWEVDDPRREGQDGEDETGEGWDSTLRLHMPRLGDIEARLHLTPAGIAIRLVTDDQAVAARLAAGRDRLDAALAAADVPMTGFVSETRNGE